jgi:hypothetical protein
MRKPLIGAILPAYPQPKAVRVDDGPSAIS